MQRNQYGLIFKMKCFDVKFTAMETRQREREKGKHEKERENNICP